MKQKVSKLRPYFPALFVLLFYTVGISQTVEQVKFYSERIEFGEVEVKRNALFDLRNFETESASRVAVPALRDTSAIIRATASHSVIFLPKDEAVQVLVPLLMDKFPFVRKETAYALGKVGNAKAVNALINILQKEKDREVRAASAVALGQIGDASAVRALSLVLAKKRKKKDEFLRRMSSRAIGNIARQIQRQKKPIITPKSFLPEKFKSLNRAKHRRLLEIIPEFRDANSLLVKILQDPKEPADVRREAAFAIGEIGDKSAIEPLKRLLNAKDYYLAEIAKEGLRKVYQNVNYANSDALMP